MVSHHSQQGGGIVRCECGLEVWPVYDPRGYLHGHRVLMGYACPKHGYLHHSAIIVERNHVHYVHIVYVRDETGNMIVNSVFEENNETGAFEKARDCYGAFEEVAVARQQVQP